METKKIIAYLILVLVIAFPFRYAFLLPPDTGMIKMMNFLLVAAGFMIFMFLTLGAEKKKV